MIARLVLAAAVAALLAGCGGGDDTGPDVSVVVLTDRPAVAQLLAQELTADTLRTQDVPAVAAAGSVSVWAALGARTVVAHYVDVAPTPMDAWRTSDAVCDEAKRLGLEFKRMPNTRLNTQIVAGAHLLNRMEVNTSNPDVEAVFEHFKGYHYQTNKTTGTTLPTPVHDEHSHPSSAMMTYALYQASRLGVQVGDADPTLGGGSHAKFDPRQFDNGYAPYQHEGSVSSMMRGSSNPARGAFG